MTRIIKFLFAAVVLTGVITACGSTKENDGRELKLSVNTNTIAADGTAEVTLTVKLEGNDVSSGAEITLDGGSFQGLTFSTTTAGNYKFRAKYDGLTSNEVTVTATPVSESGLVLTVDVNTVEVGQTVTFTVKQDGVDVTSQVLICSESRCLAANTFTPSTVGQETFYAYFEATPQEHSNEITISATPVATPDQLVLSVNKNSVEVGQTVTFTVKQGGVDVTSQVKIRSANQVLAANTFTPSTVGQETFYAYFEATPQEHSNEITITATAAKPLVLSVNKNTVEAGQTVTFTVKQDGVDVTSQVKIRSANQVLAANTFTPSTVGQETFYAYFEQRPDERSNEITVTAMSPSAVPVFSADFDANRTLWKNVAYFIVTETTCIPCYSLKENLANMGVTNNLVQMYLYYSGGQTVLADQGALVPTGTGYRDTFGLSATSYPATLVDLGQNFLGNYAADYLKTTYYTPYTTNEARTAIKVVPTINGNNVDFGVSVGAKVADDYYVAAMLVEDGIVAPQSTTSGTKADYVHNNVFRKNATGVTGDALGAIAAGEVKTKTFTLPLTGILGHTGYDRPYVRNNLALIVYTLYKKESKFHIANSVKAPIGNVTNYAYIN